MFDHAAHLGGAAFGLIFFWKGGEGFEVLRKTLGRGEGKGKRKVEEEGRRRLE
jgi:hypothetical protein